MSVHWVACGMCYTKTEGTELGGIELQRSSCCCCFFFFISSGHGGSCRSFERSPRRRASIGPLAHTFNYFVMPCSILRSFSFFLSFGNKFSLMITKHVLE